ncbi:MAG: phosphate regulon transcriptional regulator PhoB [Pseudomonadota bacterium]
MARTKVLVVEDEESIVTLLEYNFRRENFQVIVANDGEDALLKVEETQPDIVILDWMLPKMSGVEVCRQLRSNEATGNIPVIMLTARSEENDRIRGLDIGADDYLTKPFSPAELIARMRAVLRRIRPALVDREVHHGDIRVDRAGHRVWRNDEEIHLGPTEFRLLDHLIQHPGRVFSREQLLNAVWGSDVFVEVRTVDVHIGRLRKALKVQVGPDPIRTVRSAGYALHAA